MKNDAGYHVALRYTNHTGPDYRGLVTKHRFESAEEFKAWLRRCKRAGHKDYEVVAHGIPEAEVIELCRRSEKEMAERTGKTIKNARRAINRADALMVALEADKRILEIRPRPHQSR